MDYEKEYKEAQDRFNAFADKYFTRGRMGFGDVLFDKTGNAMEEFISIFPELKEELSESEDEKARKGLINFLNQQEISNRITFEAKQFWLSYLEKQKEEEGYEAIPVESTLEYKLGFKAGKDSEKQKEPENTSVSTMIPSCWNTASLEEEVERYFYYEFEDGMTNEDIAYHFANWQRQKDLEENPKSADSIPSNCVSDAKYEDRWHKVGDSLPDNPREVLCKDEAGNYFIGRYYVGEGWEISYYDDEDKLHHLNPPVSKWIDFPSEKQKEQKPVEWSEDFDEEVEKIHKRYPEVSFAKLTRIAYHFSKWANRYKDMEWSEEDEEMLESINIVFDACAKHNIATESTTLYKLRDWLKSLRPKSKDEIYKEKVEAYKLGKQQLATEFVKYLDENRPEGKMSLSIAEYEDIDKAFEEDDWKKIMRYANKYTWKPSEEQMEALIDCVIGNEYDVHTLTRLWAELKKL